MSARWGIQFGPPVANFFLFPHVFTYSLTAGQTSTFGVSSAMSNTTTIGAIGNASTVFAAAPVHAPDFNRCAIGFHVTHNGADALNATFSVQQAFVTHLGSAFWFPGFGGTSASATIHSSSGSHVSGGSGALITHAANNYPNGAYYAVANIVLANTGTAAATGSFTVQDYIAMKR